MPRGFTVQSCMDRARALGTYTNAQGNYADGQTAISSGTMLAYMDVAGVMAWNAYREADSGFANERYEFSLVPGSASYALPDDFGTLRAIQVAVDDSDSGWVALRPATVDDDRWTGQSAPVGTSISYRFIADSLELVPTPGDSRTVRLTYVPQCPDFTDPTTVVRGDDGFDQVVVLRTLVMCRISEDRPYADLQQQVNEYESKVREAAKRRDRASPAYTRDRREAWSSYPRRYGGR